MSSFVTHRRLGPHKPPKNPTTLGERLLSLFLVAAAVALAFAAIISLVRNFQPLSASTEPVLLQSKEQQGSGDITPMKFAPVRVQNTVSASKAAVDAGSKISTDPAKTARADTGVAVKSSAVTTPHATTGAADAAAGNKDAATKALVISAPKPQDVTRLRRAARVLDPELMQQMPDVFDAKVKNPCWTSGAGDFRCLPYVYVTGMFHAGALSLAEKLRAHPDVLTDACTGCQFWGEEGKSMAFYLDHMREAAGRIKQAPATKVLMDSSPSTFAFYWAGGGKAHRGFADAMKPCYTGCVEAQNTDKLPIDTCMSLNCFKKGLAGDTKRAELAGIDYDKESHNPLLVRAVYGDRLPKMILLARDPIMRLYSAFHGYPHYHGKYGKTSAGFTDYVREQVGSLRACAASYGERRCALLFEALGLREERVYFHADQLMRGMYGLFLEIWYDFIPPSSWLVIHSDDLFQQPKATVARVVDFLGLTKVNETTLDAMAAAGKVNSYTTGQEPIEPEARRLLAELYAPYNTLLAKLTGDARYEKWNQQP